MFTGVNVWSEYYIEHPEVGKKIREYDTFTSDDLDLFCDIQMAQAIAVRINAKFKREKPREITRAYIISHDREGSERSLSILADILLAKTMLRSSISVCSNIFNRICGKTSKVRHGPMTVKYP